MGGRRRTNVICIITFVLLRSATAGISVEFTSHFIAAFEHEVGPLSDRLGSAMSQTAPALVHGAVSTFVSILPLVLNPITFVVKYFFGMFGLLVGAGLLT